MVQQFGDRATFAVEIGEFWGGSSQLRIVDLWAAGKRLTVDDNCAYLPSFTYAMRSTAARVRHGDVGSCPFPGRSPEEIFRLLVADETESREQYWFMQWGPTVDNLSKYAYLDGDLVLVFTFWRPTHPVPGERDRVFVATIPPADFVATIEAAVGLLDAESPATP
ncbi:hypothetical protein ACI2K4_24010 [Micromonospora sp. NPDC050397]|uniref:hypothetical protein n=1 Tax=Micromonospora sp. NPDC050397 TaxID=3364279 RepID=UPI00384FC293